MRLSPRAEYILPPPKKMRMTARYTLKYCVQKPLGYFVLLQASWLERQPQPLHILMQAWLSNYEKGLAEIVSLFAVMKKRTGLGHTFSSLGMKKYTRFPATTSLSLWEYYFWVWEFSCREVWFKLHLFLQLRRSDFTRQLKRATLISEVLGCK